MFKSLFKSSLSDSIILFKTLAVDIFSLDLFLVELVLISGTSFFMSLLSITVLFSET